MYLPVTLLSYMNPAESFRNPYFVTDFVLTVVFSLLVSAFMVFKIRNKVVTITYSIENILLIIAACFGLNLFVLFLLLLIIGGTIIYLFINPGIIRQYVMTPMKKHNDPTKEKGVDKEKLIEDLCTAVDWLSKTKTGALITFERTTPLDDVIKSGTIINCPVTPEILETIFYEGTRLHDGACIIRGNVIVAAAVYFNPSTKAIVGKFGARHRAALGISEVSDSVTIVVSEETGRIAIAHGGIMDNVKADEFPKILRTQIIGE